MICQKFTVLIQCVIRLLSEVAIPVFFLILDSVMIMLLFPEGSIPGSHIKKRANLAWAAVVLFVGSLMSSTEERNCNSDLRLHANPFLKQKNIGLAKPNALTA